MITAGIDLAAEPKATALALIEWSNNQAELQGLFLGVDDAEIVKLTKGANKIGIDCAFGWPVEFFEFLTQHMKPNQIPKGIDGDGPYESLALSYSAALRSSSKSSNP